MGGTSQSSESRWPSVSYSSRSLFYRYHLPAARSLRESYRGTLLIITCHLRGRYSRTMPRAPRWPQGGFSSSYERGTPASQATPPDPERPARKPGPARPCLQRLSTDPASSVALNATLYEKGIALKLSGNEDYYTNSLRLLVKNTLCSQLHCQKVLNTILFSYKTRCIRRHAPRCCTRQRESCLLTTYWSDLTVSPR